MSDISVCGLRNPDTDSIVASMAYANLRNALGDREYKAVRIGAINDETQRMLDRFGFEPPMYIQNMRAQVSDLDFDHPTELNKSVPLDLAWRTMQDSGVSAIPILNDDGTLYGMLSTGDIAAYELSNVFDCHVDALPLFNLISVLEGRLVNEYSNITETISGKVTIALPKAFEDASFTDKDSILICGDQPAIIGKALEAGVGCLILCQTEVPQELADSTAATCIISTPLNARQVARLIFQGIPVSRFCQTENLISFHLADYVDDVRETLIKSRFHYYPVLDEQEHVVGTLSRYHMLRPRSKRVVLVDHNEAAQSVPGLEQVEIMAIIDHHRLADIQTKMPVAVRNEPVGSTNTILTSMYQEHGVMPSPAMAGLMCAAILSDTVMFKSPTCTKKDIAMAERLARIARVSVEDLGSLPPPASPTRARRSFSAPTTNNSTSRKRISASARSPAWARTPTSPARKNSWTSWRRSAKTANSISSSSCSRMCCPKARIFSMWAATTLCARPSTRSRRTTISSFLA